MEYISRIAQAKKKRIADAKARLPLAEIVSMLESASGDGTLRNHSPAKRRFKSAIKRPGELSLIAELKRASPSRGLIRKDFDVVKLAREYEQAGAQALSVLTEEDFFKGSPAYIGRVKENAVLPVLRKDFIIDAYQVYESALLDADCILLIAELLDVKQMKEFIHRAGLLNVEVLAEANTQDALNKALDAGADMIGINNRNLATFNVDIKTTERLLRHIPKGRVVVSESGIRTADDVRFLRSLGVNAALIGEAFLQAEDIVAKVKEVMGW